MKYIIWEIDPETKARIAIHAECDSREVANCKRADLKKQGLLTEVEAVKEMRPPTIGELIRITINLKSSKGQPYEARVTWIEPLRQSKSKGKSYSFYYFGYVPLDSMHGSFGTQHFYVGAKPPFAADIDLTGLEAPKDNWKPFTPKPGDKGYDSMH